MNETQASLGAVEPTAVAAPALAAGDTYDALAWEESVDEPALRERRPSAPCGRFSASSAWRLWHSARTSWVRAFSATTTSRN